MSQSEVSAEKDCERKEGEEKTEERGGNQDMVQAHTLAVIGAGMIGSSAARWAAAELGSCQWNDTFEFVNGIILSKPTME